MAFDEMGPLAGPCRPAYESVRQWLERTPADVLERKRREAEVLFRRIGITFAVYFEGGDPERLIPFDIVPRVLDAAEWSFLERGLEQRVRALNAFIKDVYHGREIIAAGLVPEALVLQNESFCHEMEQVEVPRDVYTHIAGIDMVRVGPDDFYVLEDNCRTPSGVSYMLQDRQVMSRLFPELFTGQCHRPGIALSRGAAGDALDGRTAQLRGRAHGRADDSGGLQQCLFRAHLPRRRDGCRAGGGGRPAWWRIWSSTCAPPRAGSGWT